jgi:hypothetical protein
LVILVMTTPNFLIIGTAKAGTTSLYSYLQQHPQIYLTPVKETNFFAFEGEKVNFRGPGDADRINRTSITDLRAYEQQFAARKGEKAIGEISPLYLYLKAAPQRIAHYSPNAKLIAILRNPIQRAHSGYMNLYKDGREPCDHFADALAQEETRIAENWAPLWHYRSMGLYHEQITRYLELFDRGQMRFFLYEDMVKDTAAFVQEILAFLEVDLSYPINVSTQRNKSGVPKQQWLNKILTTPHPVRTKIRALMPAAVRERLRLIRSYLNNRNMVKPKISPDVWESLSVFYQDDVQKTQDLLGRDLSSLWFARPNQG